MSFEELPLVDPLTLPADDMALPQVYDLSFEGFGQEAFAVLTRLREQPHIEQYRAERDAIRAYLAEPFKRFRDDLVVNWVLPNRLAYETERNVFSRLLKNDFGAGGCHHHLWMSFYRPSRKRLTDFQLVHSISPDGFETGLFIGAHAPAVLRAAKDRIAADPQTFATLVDRLIGQGGWECELTTGSGAARSRAVFRTAPVALPARTGTVQGIWIGRLLPRERVVALGGELVRASVEALTAVWPVYRFVGAGALPE